MWSQDLQVPQNVHSKGSNDSGMLCKICGLGIVGSHVALFLSVRRESSLSTHAVPRSVTILIPIVVTGIDGETTPLTGNHYQGTTSIYNDVDKSATAPTSNKSHVHDSSWQQPQRHHQQQQKQPGQSQGLPQTKSGMVYVPQGSSNRRRDSWKEQTQRVIALATSILALVLCLVAIAIGVSRATSSSNDYDRSVPPPVPLFDSAGRYVVDDYDAQTTFSDFLPGLAGIYGKPLYAFFVNRGQAIASFGVESKSTPIMEFLPANKAYQETPLVGFRTFIQGQRQRESFVVEPFSPLTTNFAAPPLSEDSTGSFLSSTGFAEAKYRAPSVKRAMYIGENEMQIHERDFEHQMETNVTYFILPEEDFGAFVRRTTIANTHSREPMNISLLDGLAKMQPAGGNLDVMLKTMGRTLEGFMGVYFPYKNSITMPFYRLSTEPSDSDFVKMQDRGHYCVSIKEGTQNDLLPIVYDTSKVFGQDTTLLRPIELYGKSVREIVREPQYGKAKTSSCFAAVEDATLGPGESVTISTFFGVADHILDVPVIVRRLVQEGFVLYKLTRTREVVGQITKSVEMKTGSKVLDAHVSQMFLDNSLRGGIPIVLGDQDDNDGILTVDEDPSLKVFHVFSRVHGDLERDYNDFLLRSTFFSQGPGRYRDVIQNRRNDVIFNPRIGSFNVRTFLSFIQADGYEPFWVEAVVFTIDDKDLCDEIATQAVGPADGHRAQREALSEILHGGPFRPGQLFTLMMEQNIFLVVSRQEFIDMVAVAARSTPMGVYDKGFWADHWTYYLDMIESYISIFPDQEERLMFDVTLPYFFSPAAVQPRRKKYVENLSYDGSHTHIQQLDAAAHDAAKIDYMDHFIAKETGWYGLAAHWQHDQSGVMFKSSVFSKLFLLATIKFSTRDANGMGIEYEAGRPGWDDANNGIPGMLGSGMPESFELKALVQYLIRLVKVYRRSFDVPEELYDLYCSINGNLTLLESYKEKRKRHKVIPWELFSYWDSLSTAREVYRDRVKITFTGKTVTVDARKAILSLERWLAEIDRGISRAKLAGTEGYDDHGESGIVPTYFAYRVSHWNRTGEFNRDGHPLVVPLNMTVRLFPLFLEGPTRMMKTVDAMAARDIYLSVRNSTLYDRDLKMYTISASLSDQFIAMGRSMAFAPGWLQNQAVWLHMSYKFYLQLLRHRLYDDFFNEVRDGGILPFMDARMYGRSPMECSSFIASSAFEDPSVRGRGFLARLSGSTAEFLSMWILMFIGPEPFSFDRTSGEIQFQLIPTIPGWIFEVRDTPKPRVPPAEEEGIPTISFKLFSSISVHYHNKQKRDLMGVSPTRYRIGLRDGSVFEYNQGFVPAEMADKIRRVVFVDSIEAFF
jgi:hypothetical protein